MSELEIEEAIVADDELLAALRRLLPQLSTSAHEPEAYEIETMVSSPAIQLLVARDGGGPIIGTLTLAIFRIPTGVRAWIEDVIVDGEARGLASAQRSARAIRRSGLAGARTVDLTSNPSEKRPTVSISDSASSSEPPTSTGSRWKADSLR